MGGERGRERGRERERDVRVCARGAGNSELRPPAIWVTSATLGTAACSSSPTSCSENGVSLFLSRALSFSLSALLSHSLSASLLTHTLHFCTSIG